MRKITLYNIIFSIWHKQVYSQKHDIQKDVHACIETSTVIGTRLIKNAGGF
jgi:hypothetical protein